MITLYCIIEICWVVELKCSHHKSKKKKERKYLQFKYPTVASVNISIKLKLKRNLSKELYQFNVSWTVPSFSFWCVWISFSSWLLPCPALLIILWWTACTWPLFFNAMQDKKKKKTKINKKSSSFLDHRLKKMKLKQLILQPAGHLLMRVYMQGNEWKSLDFIFIRCDSDSEKLFK